MKLFVLIINARKVHEQNSYFFIACNISVKLLLLHFGKRVIYVLCLITLSSKQFIWESQPSIYVTSEKVSPNFGKLAFSYCDNFTRI